MQNAIVLTVDVLEGAVDHVLNNRSPVVPLLREVSGTAEKGHVLNDVAVRMGCALNKVRTDAIVNPMKRL